MQEEIVSTPVNVLLVDDSPTNLLLMKSILNTEEYQLFVAESGEEALKKMSDVKPDIILMDIVMPGISGYKTCEIIREKETKDHVKIILVSSKSKVEERLRGYDFGADDYIAKPFNPQELRAKVAVFRRLVIAEQNLKKLNENLELEVEARTSQLIRMERLAAIGTLVANISHEVNNPLGYIFSNLKSLKKYLLVYKDLFKHYENLGKIAEKDDASKKSKTTEVLGEIAEFKKEKEIDFISQDIDQLLKDSEEGINIVKDILRGFLSFSRTDDQDVRIVDVNARLEKVIRMLAPNCSKKIQFEKELKPLPELTCYAKQLDQVFINLILNAIQAIDKEGRISISTKAEDSNIIIEISDNGRGVAKQDLEKIFDPFFTTKGSEEGTGLGLSISQGIIERHAGKINVVSELGKGTTMHIWLPINNGIKVREGEIK